MCSVDSAFAGNVQEEDHHSYVRSIWQIRPRAAELDRDLARFLRKQRGIFLTLICEKGRLSHQTLFRIEHGEHHLNAEPKLDTVLTKLKLRLEECFPR